MYTKPDFIKVSVKIQDIYASYPTTDPLVKCPPNENYSFTVPCEGTADFNRYLFTDAAYGRYNECFTTNQE